METDSIVYYKGFNKGLKCLGFKYKEGETYIYEGNISMCNRGFHFCASLSDVFKYYNRTKGNLYAIVEPLADAKTLTNYDKLCTNKLKIVKVLSDEEVDKIYAKENRDHFDKDVYCLDIVRELQTKYNLIIGGSVSLYLMGYDLRREKGKIDFDIIMPYYQKLDTADIGDGVISEIEEFDAKASGNDYTNTFALTTKDGRFLKLDVRICPEQKYDWVVYKKNKYKVCDVMATLEAKCRYAMEGNTKHRKDVLSILNKNNYTDMEEKYAVKEDDYTNIF